MASLAQFLARQDGYKQASKDEQSRAVKYEQKVKVEAEHHEESEMLPSIMKKMRLARTSKTTMLTRTKAKRWSHLLRK